VKAPLELKNKKRKGGGTHRRIGTRMGRRRKGVGRRRRERRRAGRGKRRKAGSLS